MSLRWTDGEPRRPALCRRDVWLIGGCSAVGWVGTLVAALVEAL